MPEPVGLKVRADVAFARDAPHARGFGDRLGALLRAFHASREVERLFEPAHEYGVRERRRRLLTPSLLQERVERVHPAGEKRGGPPRRRLGQVRARFGLHLAYCELRMPGVKNVPDLPEAEEQAARHGSRDLQRLIQEHRRDQQGDRKGIGREADEVPVFNRKLEVDLETAGASSALDFADEPDRGCARSESDTVKTHRFLHSQSPFELDSRLPADSGASCVPSSAQQPGLTARDG
jgi:hypothetical protein